jgi:hypothetical protein
MNCTPAGTLIQCASSVKTRCFSRKERGFSRGQREGISYKKTFPGPNEMPQKNVFSHGIPSGSVRKPTLLREEQRELTLAQPGELCRAPKEGTPGTLN